MSTDSIDPLVVRYQCINDYNYTKSFIFILLTRLLDIYFPNINLNKLNLFLCTYTYKFRSKMLQ